MKIMEEKANTTLHLTMNFMLDLIMSLDYYVDKGFEIRCQQLGSQEQVCGGGAYDRGVGFAIGFDRLMLCK